MSHTHKKRAHPVVMRKKSKDNEPPGWNSASTCQRGIVTKQSDNQNGAFHQQEPATAHFNHKNWSLAQTLTSRVSELVRASATTAGSVVSCFSLLKVSNTLISTTETGEKMVTTRSVAMTE